MANALAVLDFPAIVERLAVAASTAYGEELARALTPSPDPHEVTHRQALTAEVVALLDNAAEPPLDGIRDVRAAAAHAARGGALSTEALAHIAAAVGGGLRARAGARAARQGDRPSRRGGRLGPARQRLAHAPQAAPGAPRGPSLRHRGAAPALARTGAAGASPGGLRRLPRRPTRARGEAQRA